MNESRKTVLIVVAVLAGVLAIYSGWRTLRGSARSAEDRKTTLSGPVSSMSSMLGPDASGRPRTQYDGRPVNPNASAPRGNMMNRMMGRPGGQMQGQMGQ